VRPTTGDAHLYRIGNKERQVTDEQRAATLRKRLNDTLGKLPTGEHDEDIPDHVEAHLEEMGYL
jgi:hypothetical protein